VNERQQLFNCPGGVCRDFVEWIRAWRDLEGKYGAQSALDGFFLDLANEFYVSDATLTNEATYVHSLNNQVGQRYRIMANIIYMNEPGTSVFLLPNSPVRAVDSVTFAAQRLYPNDILLKEGFYVIAGTLAPPAAFDALRTRLVNAYAQYQTKWAVISSELGNLYVPPTHVAFGYWQSQGWISPSSCYQGPTGDDNSSTYNTCNVLYTPPTLCNSRKHIEAYRTFRQAADGSGAVGSQGGVAFTYAEARLGVFNGTVPFCANDQVPR
jgi:hypothetical protein